MISGEQRLFEARLLRGYAEVHLDLLRDLTIVWAASSARACDSLYSACKRCIEAMEAFEVAVRAGRRGGVTSIGELREAQRVNRK